MAALVVKAGQRLLAVPEWEKPCWIVALKKTLGTPEAKSKKLALKHGWDGKSFGIPAQTLYSMVIELLGRKPRLDPVPVKTKMTVNQYANLDHASGFGLVLSTGHVMPMLNSQLSNINGHSGERVTVVMFLD